MNNGKTILLKGVGYSGRGVRLALLSQPQIDDIREEAAKDVIDDSLSDAAKQQIYNNRQRALGVTAMVVEVTEVAGLKSKGELETAKWLPIAAENFASVAETYFTPKDLDLLGDAFFRFHFASKADVENILGEALDVTLA